MLIDGALQQVRLAAQRHYTWSRCQVVPGSRRAALTWWAKHAPNLDHLFNVTVP